jgi:SAM-dependent methyltransferase
MTNEFNDKDILALETISELKNYNDYTFGLISKNIVGKNVLDFGSGFGVFCEYLQKNNYEIVGFEINPTAKKRSEQKGIRTYSEVNEINKKYENITSLNVLEHVEDDEALIKDMKSLLTEEGLLILYLPSSQFVWSQMDEDVNHFRRYSKKDLDTKLTKANFKIIEMRYVDFIGWSILVIFKILRVKPTFNKKVLIFYDRIFFKLFKFLDIFFKNIIGKNLLVVAKVCD